ncbi:HNH endonuclease, partial [Vibrio parahaemolyticus]
CQKCQSTHALQIDHCFPWALGGRTEFKNLRLVCRNCNQRYAVEQFGTQKIDRYLNKYQSPPGGAV